MKKISPETFKAAKSIAIKAEKLKQLVSELTELMNVSSNVNILTINVHDDIFDEPRHV